MLKSMNIHFKVNVQYRGYFLGAAKISNIFGVLEIPDIYIYLGGGGGLKDRC